MKVRAAHDQHYSEHQSVNAYPSNVKSLQYFVLVVTGVQEAIMHVKGVLVNNTNKICSQPEWIAHTICKLYASTGLQLVMGEPGPSMIRLLDPRILVRRRHALPSSLPQTVEMG